MKTWKKIWLYPVGLYIWLTDGIKNMGKKWKPAMAMLMAAVILLSVMSMSAFAADTDICTVKVGSIVLSDDQCLTVNGATAATDGNNGGSYVAYFKDKTLYLNGLTITDGGIAMNARTVGDGPAAYHLTIDLKGVSSVTNASGNYAIAGETGWVTGRGMSLTIQGDGELTATGMGGGIWVWENITFKGSAKVNAVGQNWSGISNNSNVGTIAITEQAQVTATGNNYGISYGNNYSDSTLRISGGKLTATGGIWALRQTATLVDATAKASTNISGTNPVAYNSADNESYKWFQSTPTENAPTTYTVSFDKNGGSGTMADATGISGEYTLPANGFTAPSGKQFKAWSVGGVEKAPGEKITVTANTTVTVVWEDIPATYTVTFDKNSGYGYMAPVDGVSGEYTLPANDFSVPYKKYFKGWLVDGSAVKAPGEKITVTGDITLKAVWEDAYYDIKICGVDVTYLNASDITGEGISGTVTYDPTTKTLTLDNATIYSAYLGGTITSAIETDLDLTIQLVGNNTVYGDLPSGAATSSHRYAINCGGITFKGDGSLTVTASDSDGGSFYYAIHSDNNITIDGNCTITAISNSGRALSSYYETLIANNSTVLASTSATGTPLGAYGEIGMYSKYAKIQPAYNVTVSFDANGGTGTMADESAVCAQEYTLLANGFTAPAGKQFKVWSVNGAEKAVGDKVFFIANTTVTAVWEDIPHTCNIEPVEKVWPTCEEGGKEAHYKCEGCGKFFEDANGATEITNIATWGNLTKLGHTASGWKSDQTYHWKECTVADCSVVIDGSKAEHTSTGENVATDQKVAVCDVCGESYGTMAAHDPENTWSKDETGHWYACKTSGCTEKVSFGTHTPDHQGGATEEYAIKCSVCGHIMEQQLAHTHVFNKEVVDEQYKASGANCTNPAKYYKSCTCGEKGTETFESGTKLGHTEGTEWMKDGTYHWHICTVAGCGAVIDSSKAVHTPDRAVATETDSVKCSVCGYEIAPALGHTHAHGTEWKADNDNHWNECACGDKANTAAHKDENTDGKCDVCAYNVGVPTPPANPNNPQTGDNSMVALWIVLLCISGLGIIATVAYRRKRVF